MPESTPLPISVRSEGGIMHISKTGNMYYMRRELTTQTRLKTHNNDNLITHNGLYILTRS